MRRQTADEIELPQQHQLTKETPPTASSQKLGSTMFSNLNSRRCPLLHQPVGPPATTTLIEVLALDFRNGQPTKTNLPLSWGQLQDSPPSTMFQRLTTRSPIPLRPTWYWINWILDRHKLRFARVSTRVDLGAVFRLSMIRLLLRQSRAFANPSTIRGV